MARAPSLTGEMATPDLRNRPARSGPLRWLPLCFLVGLSLISLFCEPADLRGHSAGPPTSGSRR